MDDVKFYETKIGTIYTLKKIHPDNRQETMGMGFSSDIIVGSAAICGNWYTTTVQHVTRTGKGCIFETLNSTYLLEECD